MDFFVFLKLIKKYINPYRGLALFLLGGSLFEALFETGIRISLKFIIDEAIVPQNYGLLILILLLLGGGAIAVTFVGLLGDFFGARFGVLVINDIRRSLFERVQSLSMEFFGRRSAGDIVNCFLADTEKVENGLTIGLSVSIWNFSNILFSVIFLFSLNWQLAVLSCIGLTVCIIAPTGIVRRATKAGYQLRQKEGNIASVVEENILSQSVVKMFGLEKRASKDFVAQLNDFKRVYVRAKFLSFLVQRVPNLAFILVQLVILSISAAMTYWNWISVGTLVSYQVILIGLNATILNFTWSLPYLIEGAAGLQRIGDILGEIPEVQEATDAIDLPDFKGEIYFDNVSFSYSPERGGVKNLSLKIRQGDFHVFIGQSGAGKSTIVNLLARFYDPDEGRILFDGIDLRDCTVRSLRSQIGLVSQEVILFNGSVRENIRMGCLEASDEQVEAAAKDAEIHDFILTLPQGYDTPLGERGGQLSGGQRQRIALARALVREPAILILDEATSALDPATEAGILATLMRIAKKCTVIVITHRITPVSRNQNLPLSWSQERLWFLAQLEPDTPVYNEPCTIRFTGAIDVDALSKALNEIIKRHESLRTRFITVDSQPVQVIAPPDTFNLAVVDLRQFPQDLREVEALRIATKEAKLLFDLTTSPLLRATLMQLADEDYRLFLTFHHIVIDGVSIYSVFLPELAALYKAFSTD